MKLVIDPGHGGHAPGVVVKDSTGRVVLKESDANLATALTLKWVLVNEMAAPFEVVLTRSTDEFVPLHRRAVMTGDLMVSLHYDIPNGGAPIYYQRRCGVSAYVAYRANVLTGWRKPVWSTYEAVHTGRRLYIDDAKHPAILVEVDTIDKYVDSKEYRLSKMRPLAKSIIDIMNEFKSGLL